MHPFHLCFSPFVHRRSETALEQLKESEAQCGQLRKVGEEMAVKLAKCATNLERSHCEVHASNEAMEQQMAHLQEASASAEAVREVRACLNER